MRLRLRLRTPYSSDICDLIENWRESHEIAEGRWRIALTKGRKYACDIVKYCEILWELCIQLKNIVRTSQWTEKWRSNRFVRELSRINDSLDHPIFAFISSESIQFYFNPLIYNICLRFLRSSCKSHSICSKHLHFKFVCGLILGIFVAINWSYDIFDDDFAWWLVCENNFFVHSIRLRIRIRIGYVIYHHTSFVLFVH